MFLIRIKLSKNVIWLLKWFYKNKCNSSRLTQISKNQELTWLWLILDHNHSTPLEGLKSWGWSYFRAVWFWILMSQIASGWGESIQLKNGSVGAAVAVAKLLCCFLGGRREKPSWIHIWLYLYSPPAPSRCWWTLRVEQIYMLVNPSRWVWNKA